MTEKDIRIVALYSGSKGNSTYVRVGNTEILIDAGKSAKALCSKLTAIGSDIERISAIFITHEHTDHVSALEVISKKHFIPIHITDSSALRFDRCPESAIHKCLVRHEPHFEVEVGEIKVSSFRTPHDSKMSVGYRLELEYNGKPVYIGLATDIGYVSDSVREGLSGCGAVVLESNHDIQMLDEGPYPYDLKKRISSNRGHLSNSACAEFAIDLAEKGTKAFLLAHLSEENNLPTLALDETESALSDRGVRVAIADAEEPTELCVESCFEGVCQ